MAIHTLVLTSDSFSYNCNSIYLLSCTGNRARVPPSNGFILQTFWDLLEIELKPKGNKLLSVIELWTRSKQSDKPLNEWLTSTYNVVEVCDYPEDSKDRIIKDALIIGCSSDKAKDKIVQQGEAVTLNQVIEILQTDDAMIQTLQGLRNPDTIQQIHYASYEKKRNRQRLITILLLLANRTPVLQSCVTIAENPTARSMNPNAKPSMQNVKNVK